MSYDCRCEGVLDASAVDLDSVEICLSTFLYETCRFSRLCDSRTAAGKDSLMLYIRHYDKNCRTRNDFSSRSVHVQINLVFSSLHLDWATLWFWDGFLDWYIILLVHPLLHYASNNIHFLLCRNILIGIIILPLPNSGEITIRYEKMENFGIMLLNENSHHMCLYKSIHARIISANWGHLKYIQQLDCMTFKMVGLESHSSLHLIGA